MKTPSCVSRVLDEALCPPSTLHNICDYPEYYDALYYPQYHTALFVSAMTFCSWLLKCLVSHHRSCFSCSLLFTGCVEFNGHAVVITLDDVSVSLSLTHFESPHYHHCKIIRMLALGSSQELDLSQSLHCPPPWMYCSMQDIETKLHTVLASTLSRSVSSVPGLLVARRTKSCFVRALSTHFLDSRSSLLAKPFHAASDELVDIPLPVECPRLLVPLLSAWMDHLYGSEVAAVICRPLPPTYVYHLAPSDPLPWTSMPTEVLVARLRRLSIGSLSDAVRSIPLPNRPPLQPRSRTKTSNGIVSHIRSRVLYLQLTGMSVLCDLYLAYSPYSIDFPLNRLQLINSILEFEYGPTVVQTLNHEPLSVSERHKLIRREDKQSHVARIAAEGLERQIQWPVIVPQEIVLECQTAYCKATEWSDPPVCAVCAQYQSDCKVVTVVEGETSDLYFESLRVTDPFVIQTSIVQGLSNRFIFGSPLVDGLMLEKVGVISVADHCVSLNVCDSCRAALRKPNRIPRLALRNHLFRGELPVQFHDLTWIEEKICAIYCITAHVTRLFQSADPAQPKIFHGNTCAHDMNVVSTASVLPRTPVDINGFLSVVFVGPAKFDPKVLGTVFRVRRSKVWAFLVWLRFHNHLYAHIPLDAKIASLYPEDDLLPGLSDGVIEDHELDVRKVFEEETAGFSNHPANMLHDTATDQDVEGLLISADAPVVMLEKMGVLDPENDNVTGRACTAAALRNLHSRKGHQPDIILHRGFDAIPEYKNPDLLPGMFPTLFPCGIGGFEDKQRETPLSFEHQAQYYLNLCDRAFRYHHSYLFVILNMLQRRAAHLHTFFTVRKTNFDQVARQLTQVSPLVLENLACKLEREHNISQLSTEEKAALALLHQVNTISARIPGSHASKIYVRNEIRSYFSYFGLPHLFFTFNPSPAHSPVFQVMYGDRTVDLSHRFPSLVSARERALRLAHDPVAAANFFEFMWCACFAHLLGWDFDAHESSSRGGIFGHIRAFYGSSEYTERGSLHGHYLIWLDGGCNPSDLHRKLLDEEYQARFFAFFEDIIHHHLPDIECDIDPKFDPRVERPPLPSSSVVDVQEWQSMFQTEVKQCGEALQRHTCRAVCHKYGNEDQCRFLFPHEVVDQAHFDVASNSVVFKCLDGTVNYFNPNILVCCRHNHDLKCILSGKSAKAAMFYISDYITKMDTKTYEMLSLLSRAVARVPMNQPFDSPAATARTVLHKCLSQFTRQQQIHAQQAARYVCGLGDGIPSHNTVPMLSSLLLSYVKDSIRPGETSHESPYEKDDGDEVVESDDIEDVRLRIATDEAGQIVECNQIHHYLHCASTLADISFYDFCRRIRFQTKAKSKEVKNTHETRLGVLRRHALMNSHPLWESHELLEHSNEERGEGSRELVPRVVGMSIPRSTNPRQWQLFTLAHFKPFSQVNPLIPSDSSVEDVFNSYAFTPRNLAIMKHWEAVHECEDERDAERLRRQARLSTANKSHGVSTAQLDDEVDVPPMLSLCKSAQEEFKMNQFVLLLKHAGWLGTGQVNVNPSEMIPSPPEDLRTVGGQDLPSVGVQIVAGYDCSPKSLKRWSDEIRRQETAIAATRRNALNPNQQVEQNAVKDSSLYEGTNYHPDTLTVTEIGSSPDENCSPLDVINRIGHQFQLNEAQWVAFRIIAEHFVRKFIEKRTESTDQLTMLMTGPGGTGKTHVVKAVRAVMEYYGYGHIIRFLAPTGSAAALIDGMTIHKGVGIKIRASNKGKGNRALGESMQDYSVIVSNHSKSELREEWKNVAFLLVDEASLLGLQLLAQLDHALRVAKERPDLWFGGIALILSGDFFQYPPVGGSALYTPISRYAGQTDEEVQKRLGRLAWKTVNTVVTLSEQQRMKTDSAYGEAVSRLRVRQCTYADLELFNSRVIKSPRHPTGVDMSSPKTVTAAAIVATNSLREFLNAHKVADSCGKDDLVSGYALDKCTHHFLSRTERQRLLALNFSNIKATNSLPGIIPLYVGMPVILRARNISTDLGVTNGSQGIVRFIVTETCPTGFPYVRCAMVEFPQSKVHLSNLPDKWFPIVPVSWTFTTLLLADDGTERKLRITRHQLPIQPAFAVTGHSCQGKTLPTVLVNLHEGGFGAYVAASRAQTREGLCITQPVTLDQLNKSLPRDLICEVRRFDAIEHNTYVRRGLRPGKIIPVPDAEAEKFVQHTPLHATISTPQPSRNDRKKNRSDLKRPLDPLAKEDDSQERRKVRRKAAPIESGQQTAKEVNADFHSQGIACFPAGCAWDAENWSCAYDCVFMIMYGIYASQEESWRQQWKTSRPLNMVLSRSFTSLLLSRDREPSAVAFNVERDVFRDALVQLHSSFPRYGPKATSAGAIMDLLTSDIGRRPYVATVCSNGCDIWEATTIRSVDALPSMCALHIWSVLSQATDVPIDSSPSVASWTSMFLCSIIHTNRNLWTTMVCPQCSTASLSPSVCFDSPPSMLVFENVVGSQVRLTPSSEIALPTTATTHAKYDLRGIIDLEGFHFTARIFDAFPSPVHWSYDGQKNNGTPTLQKVLTPHPNTEGCIYVYALRAQRTISVLDAQQRESVFLVSNRFDLMTIVCTLVNVE